MSSSTTKTISQESSCSETFNTKNSQVSYNRQVVTEILEVADMADIFLFVHSGAYWLGHTGTRTVSTAFSRTVILFLMSYVKTLSTVLIVEC